jgi:hypothetical protein
MTMTVLFKPDVIHSGKDYFNGCPVASEAQYKFINLLYVPNRHIIFFETLTLHIIVRRVIGTEIFIFFL